MERDELVRVLAEFFLGEFEEGDAAHIGEWLAQGGQDVDEFVPAVQALKAELSEH